MTESLCSDTRTQQVAIIDFEASCLPEAGDSYPIEVALCSWPAPDAPAAAWSTLIAPDPSWVRDGVWEQRSQIVHGIAPAALVGAATAYAALEALDRLATLGSLAWCDGGDHDAYWLGRLATAAGRRARTTLGDLHRVRDAMGTEQKARFDREVAAHPVRHRAASDALGHMSAIAAGLGLADPTTEARAATRGPESAAG